MSDRSVKSRYHEPKLDERRFTINVATLNPLLTFVPMEKQPQLTFDSKNKHHHI